MEKMFRLAKHDGLVDAVYDWLVRPVHASTLCLFRLVYGLVMVAQIYKWMYVFPEFEGTIYALPYPGVGWVKPLNPDTARVVLGMCLVFSLCMSVGFLTRFSALVNYLTFAYLFHICQSLHNNHYILMCHVNFVGIFLTWGEWASLDCLLFRKKKRKGDMTVIPRWNLLLMQLLFCIPYFFGSVAKMNRDWVFKAQPITLWFSLRSGLFYEFSILPWVICWTGLIFDFVISFLLFWKKTRFKVAFPAALFFNFSNKMMFNIGVFPYAMVCSLILFLDSHVPALAWSWFSASPPPLNPENFTPQDNFPNILNDKAAKEQRRSKGLYKKFVLIFVGGFVLFHALFPLRHFVLYSSNPSWTEEGHLGAWHMKLRSKNGWLYMLAEELDGRVTQLAPEFDPLVAPRQIRDVETRPHATLMYAKRLNQVFEEAGRPLKSLMVRSCFSLNDNPSKQLFIPTANILDYVDTYEVFGTTGVGKFLFAFEDAPYCGNEPDVLDEDQTYIAIRNSYSELYIGAHFQKTRVMNRHHITVDRVIHETTDQKSGKKYVEYGLTWNLI
ncbi:hypothetical protein BSKO_04677 [Bryopsis sp. KO-2023]|nr:hypothetical protein BSKO_04677 [Bryopsis sp. KO-2023]